MSLSFTSPIQYFKGIGPKRAHLLEKIGIKSAEDLLYYFPRRYQDRTQCVPVSKLQIGTVATIKAEVLSLKARPSFKRGRFDILEVVVGDETGIICAVWFNQPYLKRYFKSGARVILHGRVDLYKDRIQMSSPEFELLEKECAPSEVNRIIPVYSLPDGFSQRIFRSLAETLLNKFIPHLTEVLPFDIRSRHNLLNIALSLRNIHFPQNHDLRLKAYQRLSFEEFFLYQIPLILRKLKRREKTGIAFRIDEDSLGIFLRSLPFSLTASQQKVISEIEADMSLPRPMQRLLQGEVGSGKTIIATIAALLSVVNGYQVAFMVPTEILAQQHYEKIKQQLSDIPEGSGNKLKVRIELLTSSLREKEKKALYKNIQNGDVDIVIGTHALIQEDLGFKKLGLIIIDEQHKFGVSQRALLPKKGRNPDILIMTATPIPRTLSMTLYGDLDISFLRELPQGRKKIETIFYESDQTFKAYDFIKEEIKRGRQAYIVYPLIEETPRLALSSAKRMHKEFSQRFFREFKVGLIHGKLPRPEQESAMRKFRDGELDILVATTVLEVGIDVPNATVILIEHAQRFGLSQLHQMRGRIGRSSQQSFCLLIAESKTQDARARLDAFIKYSDGFEIAERDLKIRGPGEFFGERQHGLAELKIADPLRQLHILKAAREEVVRLLNGDPGLEKRLNREIRKQVYKRFPEFEKFVMVG